MTAENKFENARAEARCGDDALRAGQALLGLGLPNDAVSRAYYAVFHYARALLLTKGLMPKTHRGVIALIGQHLASPGGLTPASISGLAKLETFRGIADYTAAERLSQERAAEEGASATAFVAEASTLLARLLATSAGS